MDDLKLVIFDMDGVIFDSEPLHDNAKRRLIKEGGITEQVDDLSWSVGLPSKLLWSNMISRYGLTKSAEELEYLQYKYILEEVKDRDIKTSEGFVEVLQFLRKQGIKIGLGSSSDRHYVDDVLHYYGIYQYFNYTVAGDEVANKKPSPDIYLKVLELAGYKASEAIAVEDSKAGSEAATAAGLNCIGYINPTSGSQDLSKCFMKINKISQITEVISKLS